MAALTLGLALSVAGCGSSDDSSAKETDTGASSAPTESPTSTPTGTPGAGATSAPAPPRATGPQLTMTVKGDKVTPNGKEMKLGAGKTLTITVVSDRAGELHVHSSPEQELTYKAGRTILKLKIDRPGVVDVEDHIADSLVAQLEVS